MAGVGLVCLGNSQEASGGREEGSGGLSSRRCVHVGPLQGLWLLLKDGEPLDHSGSCVDGRQ